MTTITKEWLQQTIAEFENTRDDIPFGLDDDDAKILIVLKRALASLDAEPVSQPYKLPELIEGMEVSIDVSTCDADLGNRYFGTVTEALELDTAKNGYILLVQDAEPNFDVNGNSPVTPDDWVMVPKEPTQAMINAWLSEVADWRGHVAGYKAMLAAVPEKETRPCTK
ncbi:hypothetical protein ACK1G0_004839 [Salmonella enterica]